MSPRKQPSSLFKICIKSCIDLVNSACYVIERNNPENEFPECELQAFLLKRYLLSMLPARLFDILCSERTRCLLRADPRIQLQVLTHPNMTVFRRCDLDNGIPKYFWLDMLPSLSKLIVLDLKFICTDEILQIIGVNCPLIEELNIVSRLDICKSPFNASVLIRNVSDNGLCSVGNLKNLRVLAMDAPRNERANRVGRCVSQSGIRLLVSELPFLEELRIESCDIGSTLIGTNIESAPLSLRKINCHFASGDGIKKLITLCPFLKEFSITHLSEHNKDEILDQIAHSELRLTKLDLSFFSCTNSMYQLLLSKGAYLTHFSLWEIDNSLTLNAVVTIGRYCPYLNSLCLMTQSKCLVLPPFFRHDSQMFGELRTLTLGCENFNIHHMLTFFLRCTQNLQKLVLKYQTKINIDGTMLYLLEKGFLRNLKDLWLDCTLVLSKSIIQRLIQECHKLRLFTLEFQEDMSDVQGYIRENNLDLKLDSSY